MEWYTWILTIVLGVSLGLIVSSRKNVNFSVIHEVNEKDFKDNMRKGQLIDIRKKEEFEKDRIKGARNFHPRSLKGKFPKIRKDQPVFLYCSNGKKSIKVAKSLSKINYKAIYVLEGGFENTKK